MSTVNVYHCQRCFAPLELPPGGSTIVCRYCGTHNDLQRPSPARATGAMGATGTRAPAAAPANGKLIAILVGLVGVAAIVALLVSRGVRAGGALGALTGPLELE